MARSTSQNLAVSGAPSAGANGLDSPTRHSVAYYLLVSLRPEQWTKNLLVFAALIFAERLFDLDALGAALQAFVVFCALSGVVYLVNDVADRASDRKHPLKCRRPVAAGALPVGVATAAALSLGAVGLGTAFMMSRGLGLVAASYLGLLLFYSAVLKHIVIIDVIALALGFVLRAAAGAVAIQVAMSHWLLVCTILLALFVGLAKRRHEIVLLADDATSHRPILGEYSPYLLDQMISVVTASTLIAYIFYTISPETAAKFETEWLGLTIPFPLYGIFRSLYLVHRREGGGSPADLLINDRPLLACVTLWVAAVVVIIYG
jgi:4-hydroxybenzoate polyprenyltransferase